MGTRYDVEVTISSARDLKNVNWRDGDLKPYVVAWIDPAAKASTKADLDGGAAPAWDEKLTLVVPADQSIDDAVLSLDVVHAGSGDGVKPLVGSARLPLCEVVDEAGIGGKASRSLKLKRPSGRPQGKLDVKVRVAVKEPPRGYYDPNAAPPYGAPVPAPRDGPPYAGGYGQGSRDVYGPPYGGGAYAAPPAGYPYNAPPQPGYGYGAPPPQAAGGYGYGAPPQAAGGYGYGAPPPQAAGGYGYGAPPPQAAGGYGYGAPPSQGYGAPPPGEYGGYGGSSQAAEKKSKFGMGTGLAVGAAAGILGGIALVEGAEYVEDKIADDAAERVEDDLGYDDDY